MATFSTSAANFNALKKSDDPGKGTLLSPYKYKKMLENEGVKAAQKKAGSTPLTPQQIEDAFVPTKSPRQMTAKGTGVPTPKTHTSTAVSQLKESLASRRKYVSSKAVSGSKPTVVSGSSTPSPTRNLTYGDGSMTSDDKDITLGDFPEHADVLAERAKSVAIELKMDSGHVDHVEPVADEGKRDMDIGDPLDPGDSKTAETPRAPVSSGDYAKEGNDPSSSSSDLSPGMPSLDPVPQPPPGPGMAEKKDEQCTKVDEGVGEGGSGAKEEKKEQHNPEFEYGDAQGSGVVMPTGTNPSAFGFNQYKATPQFEENVGWSEAGGDFFRDVQTHSANAGANLRAAFGMNKAQNVIPSSTMQLQSDIMFDMFDTVHEGFGNGEDNKLYLMEQNRDAKIRYASPMTVPGASIGPESGVQVSSWKLQREIPTEKMARHKQSMKRKHQEIAALYSKGNRDESTNVLGDDVGFYRNVSSKGLKRHRASILEPIISNQMEFTRVKMPTGAELNGFGFRRNTDALRFPTHLNSLVNGMGGPTLGLRRSLEIILP